MENLVRLPPPAIVNNSVMHALVDKTLHSSLIISWKREYCSISPLLSSLST